MNCLVTGGAGYVGSCVARLLAARGHRVTVADDGSSGHPGAIPGLPFVLADCTTPVGATTALRAAAQGGPVDAVLHFVGLISVSGSFREPGRYRTVNCGSTERVLAAARAAGVKRLVFSSTAAVYGTPERVPIPETAPIRPTSPYGETKAAVERLLAEAGHEWGLASAALRYFNAAGADVAPVGGPHGEDHRPEEHLIPRVLAAARRGEPVTLYGTDYPTPDGTCVRDYVHVCDLADAHLRALEALAAGTCRAWNVGSGRGVSVREVLAAAARASGRRVAERPEPRRPGDPPTLVADVSRAAADLAWHPTRDLDAILRDAWTWHSTRPEGYRA